MEAYCEAVSRDVAAEGEEDVRAQLGRVLKHPTGYYEAHITTIRRGLTRVIHDGGVIYGPWLEGTGSRNFPVTRFKGYSTFRRVKQALQVKALPIAERALPSYLRRMG